MFKIYALEDTQAQLCVSTSTTDDTFVADVIIQKYNQRGLIAAMDIEREYGIENRRFYPSEEQKALVREASKLQTALECSKALEMDTSQRREVLSKHGFDYSNPCKGSEEKFVENKIDEALEQAA